MVKAALVFKMHKSVKLTLQDVSSMLRNHKFNVAVSIGQAGYESYH